MVKVKSKAKDVTDIDKVIGRNLARIMDENGVTRQDTSSKVGVTHQQMAKYEKGINRIAASRLHTFCELMGEDVGSMFIEGGVCVVDKGNILKDGQTLGIRKLVKVAKCLSVKDRVVLGKVAEILAGRG